MPWPPWPGTGAPEQVLVRADSAFYGHATVSAALSAGADVPVTVRLNPAVKHPIAAIPEHAWERIEYTDALFGEATGTWISRRHRIQSPTDHTAPAGGLVLAGSLGAVIRHRPRPAVGCLRATRPAGQRHEQDRGTPPAEREEA
jgi:hypothetical protein